LAGGRRVEMKRRGEAEDETRQAAVTRAAQPRIRRSSPTGSIEMKALARKVVAGLALLVAGIGPTASRAQDGGAKTELVLTTGHSDSVHSVAFSPDGRTIV